jgi:hypothetical protein
MSKLMSGEYVALLSEVKERVRSAQYAALQSVNRELVALYWDIGRIIVGRQVNGSWGKAVVTRLAADLQAEFPGIGGFSASNLWRMNKVFISTRESTCGECGEDLGSKGRQKVILNFYLT